MGDRRKAIKVDVKYLLFFKIVTFLQHALDSDRHGFARPRAFANMLVVKARNRLDAQAHCALGALRRL